MPFAALDEGEIIQRAAVVGAEAQRLFEAGAREAVLLPLDVSQADIDVTVGVIGPQLHNMLEGVDGFGILQLIEKAYGDVIPAHPVLVVVRLPRRDRILADVQGARARGDLYDRVGGVRSEEDVVEIALPQVAVID